MGPIKRVALCRRAVELNQELKVRSCYFWVCTVNFVGRWVHNIPATSLEVYSIYLTQTREKHYVNNLVFPDMENPLKCYIRRCHQFRAAMIKGSIAIFVTNCLFYCATRQEPATNSCWVMFLSKLQMQKCPHFSMFKQI